MASLAEYIPHSDRVHERVLRWTRRLSNYKNETNARCARAGILKVRKSTFAVLLTLPQGLRFAAGEVDDGCNSYFGQLTLSCVFSLCLIKLQRCSQPCWPPFYRPTSAEAPCLVPLNLNPYCNCKLYLTVGWFLAQDLQPHLYLTGSLLFFIYLLFFSCLPAFGSPTPTDFFSTPNPTQTHIPLLRLPKTWCVCGIVPCQQHAWVLSFSVSRGRHTSYTSLEWAFVLGVSWSRTTLHPLWHLGTKSASKQTSRFQNWFSNF